MNNTNIKEIVKTYNKNFNYIKIKAQKHALHLTDDQRIEKIEEFFINNPVNLYIQKSIGEIKTEAFNKAKTDKQKCVNFMNFMCEEYASNKVKEILDF